MHVYTADGQEIVPDSDGGYSTTGQSPGTRVIVNVPAYSSTAVTLTVVGVAGGTAEVTAHWHTWACHNDGTEPGQPGWVWGTSEEVKYTVVQVDIYDLGRCKKITGLTSTIVVGQENYLEGVVTPAGLDIMDQLWTVPDDERGNAPIAGYTQTADNGTVYPLWPSDFLCDTITYYWIGDGEDLTVTYGVSIDGRTYTGETDFTVLRPVAQLDSMTTPDPPGAAVGPDGRVPSGVSLHFGDPSPTPPPGITWRAHVTTTAGEGGELAFTQLINTYNEWTNDNSDDTRVMVSSHGQFVLDGTPQYCNDVFCIGSGTSAWFLSDDSPCSELKLSMKNLCTADVFGTYLMYKSDEPGSIWVTLGKVSWNWQGVATKDGHGQWSLDEGSGHYSADPPGIDTTELPRWSANFSSLQPEIVL